MWRRLDEDLRVEHQLSLQEYEALLFLAEAEGRRLRMHRLAEALLLSKSGVTRLVDRLVLDGLVARSTCTTDARGAEAQLTTNGLDRLRTAAPTHLRGIQAYFLDAIGAEDLASIERAMTGVATAMGGWPGGSPACDPSRERYRAAAPATNEPGPAAAGSGSSAPTAATGSGSSAPTAATVEPGSMAAPAQPGSIAAAAEPGSKAVAGSNSTGASRTST